MDDAGPGDGGVDSGTDAGTDAGDMCDGVDCSGMDDECNMGVCNPATGACEQDPIADGTACDDDDACTMDDECTAGTCGGTDVDCSGMTDMCNTGVCNATSGACERMPMTDGTACDDGMMCTSMDRCTAGACAGTAIDCSGMTDMCNTGTCDPATGACGRTPVMDGTACTDAMACSTGDRCVGGACTPTGSVDCSAMTDMCNVGTCNPADGSCGRTPAMDGTTCDDMDTCTAMDACTGGVCGGTPTAAGDTCGTAIDLPTTDGTHMISGMLTTCHTNDGTGTCAGGGRDAIYRLVLAEPRVVRLGTADIGPGDFDTVLHVRTACGDPMTEVACDDDGGPGLFSFIEASLPAGTYFVYLDAFGATATGGYRLDLEIFEPDTCAQNGPIPIPAPGATVVVSGDTTGAIGDFTSTCGGGAASPDHVYEFTVTERTALTLETFGGSYDTVLHVRGFPCVGGAGTTLFCDDDGGTEPARSRITGFFAPGTYYVIVDGFSTGRFGTYNLRVTRAPGQAVLIGHDYFVNETNADRVVANAVLLSNNRGNPVNVVQYIQFSDNSALGEAQRTRNAITAGATAAGRAVTFTDLTDYTLLNLATADVLLVPEQEATTAAMLQTISTDWNADLNDFLDRGGVIVVADFNGSLGGTFEILDGPGLMTIPGSRNVTSSTVTVAAATDPVAAGVAATYTAPDGSLAFPGATGGTAVINQGADPVVLHLSR